MPGSSSGLCSVRSHILQYDNEKCTILLQYGILRCRFQAVGDPCQVQESVPTDMQEYFTKIQDACDPTDRMADRIG